MELFHSQEVEKEMRNFLKTSLLFVILWVHLLGLPTSSLSQGPQVWTNLGLYGGQIYDIAIDPSNPEKMFAGSYLGDGLFVTTDGGGSWQAVEATNDPPGEATFKNHAVWAVKIAPSNPDVVWAAHNYWVEKSTDGGQNWTHIRNSAMQRDCVQCGGEDDSLRFCRSLAVDPSDSQTVYVGTGGPSGTYSSGAIYKTADGGSTWTKTGFNASNEFDHSVVDIDIDQQNSNVIWAVTSSFGSGGWAGTLYRSVNGGATWEIALALGPFGGAYLTVAAKPGDPNTAFTGSGFGIIKHRYDEGQMRWNFSVPYPQSANVQDISFDPMNSSIVYAVWLTPTYWGGDGIGKVARSLDGGDHWLPENIYSHAYNFLSIAVEPTNADFLFGGDLNLGVFKSQDHGQTWTSVNNGINAVQVADIDIDPSDSNHIVAATTTGVYEKTGAGDWSRISHFQYSQAFSVRFHPASNTTIYAGIEGQLAKTTNGGASWTFSNLLNATGSADNYVSDIAIDPTSTTPQNADILIAVNGFSNYGEIYKSIDGGNTFDKVLNGENQSGEKYAFNTVAIDPAHPQHLYAGGGNFFSPKVLGDLWESEDGGVIWTRTGLQNKIVNEVLIDPQDPRFMYAGCGYSGGTDVPLYRSRDSGATWTAAYEGMPGLVVGLNNIWGTSPTDLFTVGSPARDINVSGNLHYDGKEWTPMETGTQETLYGVWGSSGIDVFAVGSFGTILHYDGSSWSALSSGIKETLHEIWGNLGTDVFAVGNSGTILHYDGSTWSALSSGTTKTLYGVWGSSGTDVFVVGNSGTILHYNGSTWSILSSGTTEDLYGVWGSSGTDVFAVGDDGTILYYDGGTWAEMDVQTKERFSGVWGSSGMDVFFITESGGIFYFDGRDWSEMRSAGVNWNAVTDLEFHRQDSKVIYAATYLQGVYVSPDQAGNWLNLGTPDFSVSAISTSSLFAATQGGLLQCTGTGVVAGKVTDSLAPALGVDAATVTSDLGVKTISIRGLYMMVHPAGEFAVTASADGYISDTAGNVTVLGGDVTWGDVSLRPDLKIVDVLPHANAGIDDSTRVPHDTSFAVLIHDADGIDITDRTNIKFTINDGVHAKYTRDRNQPTFRVIKLNPGESDTAVTQLWVVYDRSNDNDYSNAYEFDKVISIEIDATDVTGNRITPSAEYRFRSETAAEYADAQARVPETEPVDSTDPDLGSSDYEGIQVTSGPLKGAKIIYKKGEPVTPKFGPLETLPTLNIDGSQGVGVPMSLQPHTVFETPVKIFLPCPAFEDVSPLSVCVLKDKWEVACDADGNVLSAGVGWIEPGSRENDSNGNPSMIGLRVYHFTDVQAASNAAPSTPSFTRSSSGGSSGGGGGCFIATCMESHTWLKGVVRIILYPVIGIAWLMLSTSTIAKGFIGLCLLAVWLGASKN